MSNKFNASSLTEYCKSYARKVAGDFFAHHTVISGQELLKLSPVSQVNLFVIGSLSDKWRSDAERFRSPFFDFEHPDVRQAMQVFMNTVSQHISVRRENLEPLLADATRRTLILLFDPRHYFDEALRNQPEFSLTADAAHLLTRYTQINKFVPAAIEERMKGKSVVYVNQALNWLDEILMQRSRELEKPEKYIPLFSEKLLLDPGVLLRKSSYDFTPPQPVPGAAKSFFDTEVENTALPAASLATPPAVSNGSGLTVNGTPPDPDGTVKTHFLSDSGSTAEPTAPSMQPSYVTTRLDEAPTLEMGAKVEEDTSGPVTIGETFYRAPIESISKSISLNQKFMFINQLFNGNAASYNEAIEELNRATSYDQARDLVSYRYAAQYLWDMSSDEVAMLIDILKRRFA
ncbi:hypothetical protein GCM10028803_57510 [Larkinella knui]|uniref:Uncharacterized protein n=1 Tax=Larkinella knui TaxID=2025310 RepID=A0A3P1CHT2_9BACT|nr:hypothetical protein [Larkinella knui]RRB12810.1 hypothetical protein EHT87_21780 [Larkinella knui]